MCGNAKRGSSENPRLGAIIDEDIGLVILAHVQLALRRPMIGIDVARREPEAQLARGRDLVLVALLQVVAVLDDDVAVREGQVDEDGAVQGDSAVVGVQLLELGEQVGVLWLVVVPGGQVSALLLHPGAAEDGGANVVARVDGDALVHFLLVALGDAAVVLGLHADGHAGASAK